MTDASGPGRPTARRAALIFDFDGTLVDSGDIKQRAYRAAIQPMVDAPETEIQRGYDAHGTLNRRPQLRNAFMDLCGRPPTDQELDCLLARYGACVRAESHTVRPFAEIPGLLASLRKTHVLAIASNAPQEEVARVSAALSLDEPFDAMYGFPTTKESAIARVRTIWGLPRSSVLYIGDRPEDAKVAERAKVPFCRFGPLEPRTERDVVRTVEGLRRAIKALERSRTP